MPLFVATNRSIPLASPRDQVTHDEFTCAELYRIRLFRSVFRYPLWMIVSIHESD